MGFTAHRMRLVAGFVACCGFGAATAAPAMAAGGMSKVPGGINAAALPNATVFGDTPADTPETVSFVFRAENLSQLEAKAQAGFRPYLSVSQFAATYGQPESNIQALETYLAGYGITTSAYPNNLDVVATGTAGEFDSALDVSQQQYSTPAQKNKLGGPSVPAQKFHGVTTEPSLPNSIAANIIAVLGLTNYSPMVTNTAHVNTSLTKTTSSTETDQSSTSPSECIAESGFPEDCHTPADFASEYGLDPLYDEGAAGQGQTIGIVTFASVDPGAPEYFWSNVIDLPSSGRTVTFENVDGGSGAPSYDAGSGETDLDTEQSGAVAPDANIVVYQAPNTDYGQVDAFFTAATQNIAGSVSMSWGESETYLQAEVDQGAESSGFQAATDEAMLELDAQGQASFVSSGDAGAYTASEDIGTTNLSVSTPSDSPYTTSAGGTTLPWSGELTSSTSSATVPVSVPQQRMWGWDYLWKPVAELTGVPLLTSAEEQIGGDGGGYSTLESEPSYQQGVSGTNSFTAVPWLTPTDYTTEYGPLLPTEWTINPNPGTIRGTGSGRVQPDLGTDADPYTGYVLYAPSNTDVGYPALMDGWGGTSFVAPELNGSAAVIDSALGHRTGFWNPSIYRFATSRSTPFTPLGTSGTTNDDLYYSGTPGNVFDPGAGLGIPDLGKLGADFASQG